MTQRGLWWLVPVAVGAWLVFLWARDLHRALNPDRWRNGGVL